MTKNATLTFSAIILLVFVFIAGLYTYKSSDLKNPQGVNTEKSVSWQTYKNKQVGFSIEVPKKVLSNYLDENSWTKVNIFEDKDNVYFTTYPLSETLANNSWQFKIGFASIKSRDEVLPFIEKYYNVKGCTIEYDNQPTTGVISLGVYRKNMTLSMDDEYSCWIGGKHKILYNQDSGKLITYRIVEPFYYVPQGELGEESLASLKFPTE